MTSSAVPSSVDPVRVRVVCFDVGGTLVRVEDGSASAAIARLLGVPVEEMRSFVNRRAKRRRVDVDHFARDVAHAFGRPDLAHRVAHTLRRLKQAAANPELYDDVRPALADLRTRGFQVVFLTNLLGAIAPPSDHSLYLLADAVFNSCDTGYVKPERSAFQHVERALRRTPDEFLHVGDSMQADGQGALEAGWQAVLVGRPDTPIEAAALGSPLPRLAGLAELLELLPSSVATRSTSV